MKVAVFNGSGEYEGMVRVCHASADKDINDVMKETYPESEYIVINESELPDPLTQSRWVISNGNLTVS